MAFHRLRLLMLKGWYPPYERTALSNELMVAAMALFSTVAVHAECYGEGQYMGCSEVGTDSDGDVHAKSWDTESNTYHVDTDTRPYRNGHEIESMIWRVT